MASVFRGSIEFFAKLGIFDVILPFLLVYTITYAILQKTKILGKDKKSIDAVVAFASAFFVVASTKLVAIISKGLANVMLVMIVLFCFLMLASFLNADEEGPVKLSPGTKKILGALLFLIVVLIFFQAIGWLSPILGFIGNNWNGEIISSIALLGVFIGLIAWVSGAQLPKAKDEKK